MFTRGKPRAFVSGAHEAAALPGSRAANCDLAAELPIRGTGWCLFLSEEGPKAMAGSPVAETALQRRCADSVSPSCLWLSRFRENHERQSQCSIFIVCNLTGVADHSH